MRMCEQAFECQARDELMELKSFSIEKQQRRYCFLMSTNLPVVAKSLERPKTT